MSKQKRKLKKNQVQVDGNVYTYGSPTYNQMYEDKFEGGDVVWDNLLGEWVSVPKGMNDAWDELYKNQRVSKAQNKVRKGTASFARPILDAGLEMSGAAGTYRFAQDPLKNLKGTGNVLSYTNLPGLIGHGIDYMQGNPFFNVTSEDLEGLANTVDVAGLAAPLVAQGLKVAPRLLSSTSKAIGKVPKVNSSAGIQLNKTANVVKNTPVTELEVERYYKPFLKEDFDTDLLVSKIYEYQKKNPNLTEKELQYLVLRDSDILKMSNKSTNINLDTKYVDAVEELRSRGFYYPKNEGAIKSLAKLFKGEVPDIQDINQFTLKDLFNATGQVPTQQLNTQFTPKQLLSIDRYSKGYDSTMNSQLRNPIKKQKLLNLFKKNTGQTQFQQAITEDSNILLDAIKQNKFEQPTELYRGVTPFKAKIKQADGTVVEKMYPTELVEGDEFLEKGFMSTTTNPWVGADDFIINAPGNNKQSFLYLNSVPESSHFINESEALLPPGLKLKHSGKYKQKGEKSLPIFDITNPYMQTGVVAGGVGTALMSQEGIAPEQKAYGGKITNMKKKNKNNLPKYYNGTPGVGTPGTQGSLFNMLSGLQQLGNNQNPTLGNQNPNFQQMPNQNLSNMNVTGKGMSNALQGATGPLAGTMKMLNGPLAPLMGMAMSSVTDMFHAINTPERERRPVLQNAASYTFDNGGIIDEYGTGGTIKIKPSKKGTFTKAAKKHGKSVQAFASQVLANKDNYSPAMVKKANFARNAAKWKKAMGGIVEPEIFANGGLTGTYMDAFDAMAYGGMIDPSMAMQQLMYGSYAQGGQVPQNIPVEVEGEEMYEMPNGQTGEFSGPKHENGGMPMALPEGTKIYSDRLKVNGKTMAARKDKREANIAKLEKLLTKNPNDKFLKEALKRQQETNALQEQGDMQQQEMANQQQAQEEMAMEEMLMGAAQQDMQEGMMMAMGGMIKRADGSYSQRGLWDNIRANAGSGKKPTKEMLKQEKKIKAAEKAYGGMVEYAYGGTLNKYAYGGEPCPPGFVKDASGNCIPASREISGVDINRAFRKGGTGQIELPGVNPYDVMSNVLGQTFENIAISKDPYINTKGGMIPNPLYNEVIGNKMLREEDPKKPNRFMNFLNNAVDETGDFFTGLFDRNGKPKKERGTNTNLNVNPNIKTNYDLTEGDRTGMFGTSVGMYGPALMTMLNRMETPPNTNYFSTFGQDALRTQEEAEGLAGISKDEAYRKNLMRANALRKQLANTARGVNDIRSGQLTAELAEQEGARGILTNYLQGMSQLKGQRAGLQQQIDQTRMGGEQQRDLADRQDIDQYYTNLAENVANASNMIQKQGRDLNVVQYNKDIMNLSKAYSKYGVYAVRDPRTGLLTLAHTDANGKITYLSEEEVKQLPKQQPNVITSTVEEPKAN